MDETGNEWLGENGLLKSLYGVQRKQYADGKLLATELANTCFLLGKRGDALGLLEEGFARRRLDIVNLLSNRNSLILKDEPRTSRATGSLLAKSTFLLRDIVRSRSSRIGQPGEMGHRKKSHSRANEPVTHLSLRSAIIRLRIC